LVGGKNQDFIPLVVELGPPNRDKPHIVGPRVKAKASESIGVQHIGMQLRGRLPVADHGRVLVEFRRAHAPESRLITTEVGVAHTTTRSNYV
jgi:hypothetical protein